ncbi:hypothetical protein JR338_03460 [Chloroflexota bacterium]|nr:hypothetical protein JR338_03460 [Chloroflexota bacterium]
MKLLNKKPVRIFAIVIIVIILVSSIYFLTMNPRRGTVREFYSSMPLDAVLTKKEAEQDLTYFYSHLRSRHPGWLDGSQALIQAVEDQYNNELVNLKDSVTVLELWQSAGRIAAQLNDGHTWVKWKNPNTSLYIDNFMQLSDYGSPLDINGVPIGEILDHYLSMTSFELQFYAEAVFYKTVIVAEPLLVFCGVDTSDGVEMTFETEDGEQTFHYEFVPLERVVRYAGDVNDENWVEYIIDLENDLGIFTLRSCVDNEEYRSVLDSFFSEVFENDLDNVVVDLRGNGGGNSRVANKFLQYLDVETYRSWDSAIRYGWLLKQNKDVVVNNHKQPVTFSGDIYVLTDTFTYSAAMDFAMLISDNDLGVLVGMPSGNLPDSYGDCLFFQMPNSGLMISISYKSWHRIDSSHAGEPVMPDYVVPSAEAFDKALELIQH